MASNQFVSPWFDDDDDDDQGSFYEAHPAANPSRTINAQPDVLDENVSDTIESDQPPVYVGEVSIHQETGAQYESSSTPTSVPKEEGIAVAAGSSDAPPQSALKGQQHTAESMEIDSPLACIATTPSSTVPPCHNFDDDNVNDQGARPAANPSHTGNALPKMLENMSGASVL
ncbi:hypothetical protein BC938DRAFT_475102, partial [Jimgerdemannia flammicorona]